MNLDELIKFHGRAAVLVRTEEHNRLDKGAVEAMTNPTSPERHRKICSWLGNYRVFMGFDAPARDRITKVILDWADGRAPQSEPDSTDAIVEAQQEVMQRSQQAFGATRNFTSLASKALWLRYPRVVPLFDINSRHTLTVLSKFDGVAPLVDSRLSEYHQFVIAWKSLFHRHRKVLEGLDLKGYPYLVRVFDQILWDIGSPNYDSLMEQTDVQ